MFIHITNLYLLFQLIDDDLEPKSILTRGGGSAKWVGGRGTKR